MSSSRAKGSKSALFLRYALFLTYERNKADLQPLSCEEAHTYVSHIYERNFGFAALRSLVITRPDYP